MLESTCGPSKGTQVHQPLCSLQSSLQLQCQQVSSPQCLEGFLLRKTPSVIPVWHSHTFLPWKSPGAISVNGCCHFHGIFPSLGPCLFWDMWRRPLCHRKTMAAVIEGGRKQNKTICLYMTEDFSIQFVCPSVCMCSIKWTRVKHQQGQLPLHQQNSCMLLMLSTTGFTFQPLKSTCLELVFKMPQRQFKAFSRCLQNRNEYNS